MSGIRTSIFAVTAAFGAAASIISVANAQPVDGLYMGAGLGGNFMGSEGIQASRLAGTSSTTLQNLGFGPNGGTTNVYFTPGFVGLASIGWGFGNGLRLEAEPSYRTNAVSSISGLFASPALSSGGTERKYGLMLNAAYDFYGLAPWVVPYVGVGVGYAWANWDGVNVTDRIGDIANISNTKGAFAYQAILGTAFPMSATPGLSITTEFRFMGMAGTRDYSGAIVFPRLNRAVTGTEQVGSEYNYALLVGIRYAFNTPRPMPPPPVPVAAPAPAPSRSYLVFLDWDKATLTDRARQIIKDAADNSTHVQYTRIEVNGYTDTSGTAKYNQTLSVRRAEAVAAELVRDGVPRSGITIQGFGDTHLLVPTGQGVREPQNRRVEIIIR
ncbi:MAG: OmpA family protein [Rhodopila sp.]|nr:OmpA family protein [Rhodopila sp.]